MNKLILKFSIAGLSLLTFGTVHAQAEHSAKIDFTGTISPVTCVVRETDRSKGVRFEVVPPATGFTGGSVGSVATAAHEREFTITLESCTTPGVMGHPSQVRVAVTGGVNTEGRLSTSNSSIDIQVMQPNAPEIVWHMKNLSRNVTLRTDPVDLTFRSRYYIARLPVISAAANASATFTMDYP